MKCVEMVVTGIEEGTQVVSEIELKLAEHQDLPDELEDLEREHRQLLNIQQMIHDHQVRLHKGMQNEGTDLFTYSYSRPKTRSSVIHLTKSQHYNLKFYNPLIFFHMAH